MKFLSVLLILSLKVSLDALPNDMYLGGQYSYYFTNNLWNCHGVNLPAHNEFMRHDSKIYGGFDFNQTSCWWFQGGFDSVQQEVNPNRHGFEDSNLGVYNVFNQHDDHSYGCGLQLYIPGGDPRPALRYGAWAGELYLSAEKVMGYLHYTFDLGYRIYGNNISDALRAAFRIDWPFTERIQVTAQGDLDYAVFNGKRHIYDNKMAFNPNTRLFKAKVLAVYRITKVLYINAGYFKYIWGQNVGTGGGVFGGAFWNY